METPETTETTDPREIEELIEQIKMKRVELKPDELMKRVSGAKYFIPVLIQDQEVLKELSEQLKNTGKAKLPANANPVPVLINNERGEQFVGIYTSRTQIPSNVKNNSIIQMPFLDVMRYASQPSHGCVGVVINPFTQNFVLKVQGTPNGKAPVSPEQMHELARRNVEFALLPHGVFKDGKEYFDHISTDFVYGLYAGQYSGKLACPFKREQIEVMTLGISEQIDLVNIVLPTKPGTGGCAAQIIITWNKWKEQAGYYVLTIGGAGNPKKFLKVDAAGKASDLGEVPPEGSEMSAVLKLEEEA